MSFEAVKSVLAKGGQHLGDLIWWTLAEARISRSDLESIWAGAQLAPELLPEPPTAEKAIKLAARTPRSVSATASCVSASKTRPRSSLPS